MIRMVLAVVFLTGAAWGAPVSDRRPPAHAAAIGEISARAASNDWIGAAAAWREIDLRKGDAAATIRAAAQAVPTHPEAWALRREMATKYRLLADKAAPLPPELCDVAPFEIAVVEVVPAIKIRGLGFSSLDIITLQPDVLRAMGIVVPVVEGEIIQIDDAQFLELMRRWELRYTRQIDYFDVHGNRLVPAPGTVLWRERQAMLLAVESSGDPDALWDSYQARLALAIGRRLKLGRK